MYLSHNKYIFHTSFHERFNKLQRILYKKERFFRNKSLNKFFSFLEELTINVHYCETQHTRMREG